MTTTHYIVIAHLILSSYVFGKESDYYDETDSVSAKIIHFFITLCFGSLILIINLIIDSGVIEFFKGGLQLKFYWQYLTGGSITRLTNEELASFANWARELMKKNCTNTLAQKHMLFCIGFALNKQLGLKKLNLKKYNS